MLELTAQIKAAADAIRNKWPTQPRVGIVLGSGLGNFASRVAAETIIPYGEIPHFPRSTVLGHKGQLVCGDVSGVPVATMEGRFHYYEGYGIKAITLPIRVMMELGIELLIVSNASGGLNPQFSSGDIVVIDDHINMMFQNPLIGINDDDLGPRFPDMSCPYDRELSTRTLEIAGEDGFAAQRGVYAALTGPSYETRAEYRMLRTLGADVVGMSTVPEVMVAMHGGVRVLALSVVANLCRPDVLEGTSGQEVVDVARAAEPSMTKIVTRILDSIA